MDDRSAQSRRRPSIPARLLGTGARGAARIGEATGIDSAVEAITEEAIVRAVESQAVERALARVLEGPALEEAVARALESPAVERALLNAIDSEMVDHVWERLLASDEAQKLVERIAEAPEVRSAIAAQGVGFIQDIGEEAGKATRKLDDVLERLAGALTFRCRRQERTNHVGIVSRAIAAALDALILNLGFFAASSVFGIVASAVFGDGDPNSASALVVGGALWSLVGGLYLVSFWALAGQTPGMRFLGIRLDSAVGPHIGLRRAVRRLFGLILAAIPFGLGFLGILTRDDRRGWQDRIAGTDVLYLSVRERAAPWSAQPAEPAPP